MGLSMEGETQAPGLYQNKGVHELEQAFHLLGNILSNYNSLIGAGIYSFRFVFSIL
jgi:hypothetical protein